MFLNVYDFFEENGTSYRAKDYPDYPEGKTLKQYVEEKKGILTYVEVFDNIRPVIQSLQKLHEQDILHLNISPENVLVRGDGSWSLADFGNVVLLDSVENKHQSKLITVKRGYSPIEQYTSEEIMGPWTDEYAMAATIYYCLTGEVPSEATERAENNDLVPQTLKAKCPLLQENVIEAILKGMGIHKEERFPDIKSFEDALYPAPPLVPDQKPGDRLDRLIGGLMTAIRSAIRGMIITMCIISPFTLLSVWISTWEDSSDPTAMPEQTEIIATGHDWQTVYSLDGDVPVGAVVRFGTYPQDSEGAMKKIYWYVVDNEDDKVLLVSQYVLDRPCAHDSENWENSKIRAWLNNTFIVQAFKEESQREKICMSTIDNNSINDLKDKEGLEQGVAAPETEDRIFLLSLGENDKYLSEQIKQKEGLFLSDSLPTRYAVSHGASVDDEGYGLAFTRSFSQNGTNWGISTVGKNPGNKGGVRPAMWVYTGVVYYSKEKIKQAQEILNTEGYACGTPDGLLGDRTVRTLKDYQEDHNLSVTGTLTEETYVSLSEID